MVITKFDLQRIMPRCPEFGMWAEILNMVMEEFEINTVLRASAFLAMCADQSNQLTVLNERFSKECANNLYANKFGNGGPATGDAWRFRGRGIFHIIGRSNYRSLGNALDLPLEDRPELLEDPYIAARSAAHYWQSRSLNKLADKKDFHSIEKCIDGAQHGLDEAVVYWEIAQLVLSESSYLNAPGDSLRLKRGCASQQEHISYGDDILRGNSNTSKSQQNPSTSISDPPRSAYAVLDCPDSAIAEEEFTLIVGLGKEQANNVTGGTMIRPPSSIGPYRLTIQAVADGFMLRTGESWRRELMVTAEAPYPTVEFHLTPEAQQKNLQPRIIQAMYSVDGQTMGAAFRPITVVKTAGLLDTLTPKTVEQGIDFSIPTNPIAPDLTIRILEDAEREGRLLWDFDSPHADIITALSHEPIKTYIGQNPQAFTRLLINRVNLREGQEDLYPFLCGIGQEIADKMPTEFWTLFTALIALSKKLKRTPTVLLLSQEPYIPWELAVVEPLLDSNAPPFLSAQVNLGRWVLRQRRPKLPPPTSTQLSKYTR